MIDWNDIGKQLEPAITDLLKVVLTGATAIIGLAVKGYLDSHTRAKDAQTVGKDLQNAQEVARVNVQAAAQRSDLPTNEQMKAAALQGTADGVPDALKGIADNLVESAVYEKKQGEAGPVTSENGGTP